MRPTQTHTNLAATILSLMEKNRVTGKDVSRQSVKFGRHLGSSYLSRLTTGIQTWIAPRDLEILCHCLSADPKDHAELVKSHLLDERPAFASQLVEVSVPTSKPNALNQVTPATRSAIEFLSGRKEAHDLIFLLARTLGMP